VKPSLHRAQAELLRRYEHQPAAESAPVSAAQAERDRILALLRIRRTTLQSLGQGWTARLREVQTIIDMIQP
jgi:hypothetical protein